MQRPRSGKPLNSPDNHSGIQVVNEFAVLNGCPQGIRYKRPDRSLTLRVGLLERSATANGPTQRVRPQSVLSAPVLNEVACG
jgi:hypothetical protein